MVALKQIFEIRAMRHTVGGNIQGTRIGFSGLLPLSRPHARTDGPAFWVHILYIFRETFWEHIWLKTLVCLLVYLIICVLLHFHMFLLSHSHCHQILTLSHSHTLPFLLHAHILTRSSSHMVTLFNIFRLPHFYILTLAHFPLTCSHSHSEILISINFCTNEFS